MRPESIPDVSTAVTHAFRTPVRAITEIQQACSDHYRVQRSQMLSRRRSPNLVKARQIAMYLSCGLTTLSTPEIARMFAGRDHTTIVHGAGRIEDLLWDNPEIQADLTSILSVISTRAKQAHLGNPEEQKPMFLRGVHDPERWEFLEVPQGSLGEFHSDLVATGIVHCTKLITFRRDAPNVRYIAKRIGILVRPETFASIEEIDTKLLEADDG